MSLGVVEVERRALGFPWAPVSVYQGSTLLPGIPVNCSRFLVADRNVKQPRTRTPALDANVDSFMAALSLPVMRFAKNSRARWRAEGGGVKRRKRVERRRPVAAVT